MGSNTETPLLQAVTAGNLEQVEKLLASGADVDQLCTGRTALFAAASTGKTQIVKRLIEAGANVNKVLPYKSLTALFGALGSRNTDTMRILLEKGANVNVSLKNGNTPIHLAAVEDIIAAVKELEMRGANIRQINLNNENILHIGLSGKCGIELLEYLLQKEGINVNQVSNSGETPLSIAIMEHNEKAVKLLMKRNNIKWEEGDPEYAPPFRAAMYSTPEMAKTLLEFKDKFDFDLDYQFTLAVRTCNKDLINKYIKSGVDVTGGWNDIHFMHHAITIGNVEIVQLMLDNGEFEEILYEYIGHAVETDHLDVVKLLLGTGADINGGEEHAPLMYVNSAAMVGSLVELGADVKMAYYEGMTSLHEAILQNRDLGTIEALVDHGADIFAINDDNKSPFDLAVAEEQWDAVDYLIKKGVKIREKSNCIIEIVSKDQSDTLRLLFQHNTINVNATADGWSLLHYAARIGAIECCKVLVSEYNAIMDIENPSSPLHMACKVGSMEVVEFLVESGANINIRRGDGISPIYLAVIENNIEMVEYMLTKGARPNIPHNEGHTLLHAACLEANKEMIELLIDHLAEIHASNNVGDTPLLSLCQAGSSKLEEPEHVESLKLLLAKGAKINATQKNGCSAIMLAAEQGLTELVEELISRGGNVNAKTIKDNNNSNAFPGDVTALQLAAQNGHLEMVKLLIENGAEVNVMDTRRISPLLAAQMNHHKSIQNYLRAHGALEPHIAFQ